MIFMSGPSRMARIVRTHYTRRTVRGKRDGAAKSSARQPLTARWSNSLEPAGLYEARDLAPTKGVLHDHLGLGERVLADTVFPDGAAARPRQGW